MGTAKRQLKAMLIKNWLLKIRHPFVTATEILLPCIVMFLLIAIRTRVDTRIHPAQPYIRQDMFVEVGEGISPNLQQVLEVFWKEEEFLAFAPDTEETRMMINLMSIKFPLMKQVSKVYKDELELETYIRSDLYGACNGVKGGIPLPIFSEWWLTKEKFSIIDTFVRSSFPGAAFQGCNGLSVKYQLPYGDGLSLADVFGHLEKNRNQLGIAEYSISQATLETIFNHFAANF